MKLPLMFLVVAARMRSPAMSVFVGMWIANIEKSRRHANHQFHSATLTFEISGDQISMTHAGVNMSGKRVRPGIGDIMRPWRWTSY